MTSPDCMRAARALTVSVVGSPPRAITHTPLGGGGPGARGPPPGPPSAPPPLGAPARGGIRAVGDARVAVLERPPRHVAAHPAETHHADLHRFSLISLAVLCQSRSSTVSTATRSTRRPWAIRLCRSPIAWAAM